MSELTKTLKLHIHPTPDTVAVFKELTEQYRFACDFISQYVFDNGFPLNFMKLQDALYSDVRNEFGLKSQFTISAFKTVTARYKTLKEQLFQNPYKYQDEKGKWIYVARTLDWTWYPIKFRRPQADFVRGRDYSFVDEGKLLSLNTLGKRVTVTFDVPKCFEEYFDGTWKLGTGKLVSSKGKWYFHILVTKEMPDSTAEKSPKHIVGIDRGLRFLTTSYDEKGKCVFQSGKSVMEKRERFQNTRSELQSKGTKSAKRRLKAISGRENRWMTDVNHQLSKTLVDMYGSDTLFVLEDLTNVSFDTLETRNKDQRREIRSWAFYQFEQMLMYKSMEVGSVAIKVAPDYTSQRCPKCGRIHKENRNHETHEYVCDSCGYRSNDDRVGAMNLYTLGTLYVSGDTNPRFGSRHVE